MRETTDGQPPAPGLENAPAPQPINPATGQHGAYWVLSAEERAKGFVRPVREVYVHAGERPQHPLRDLTEEERDHFSSYGYEKFEAYPEGEGALGRFWTPAQLASGCGTETRMGLAIAETYAREPKYYGSTFCVRCRAHFPVAEFKWVGADGRATDEILGS